MTGTNMRDVREKLCEWCFNRLIYDVECGWDIRDLWPELLQAQDLYYPLEDQES